LPKSAELTTPDAFRLLGERLKAQAVRPNVYGYKPHAKQEQFHQSNKRRRLYIGGNRSGKTTGGVIEDIWWATGRHPYLQTPKPPIRGRVVTTSLLDGLLKIMIPEFQRWCPVSDLRGGTWTSAYDKQERVLNFANGSTIEFMSYDQDLDKFAGTSRHFIHFDEEPPEDIYTECRMRVVDTEGSIWFTMTPVEGMTWIYDRIFEPGQRGESNIEVIIVDIKENPYLNQSEIDEVLSELDDDERKARGEGKFVQLGGLIYKHFDPRPGGLHVLDEIRVPPNDWLWGASLDHGFNNATAWLWHAVSPDGRVLTFYEHYQSGWTIDAHAKEVLRICTEVFKRAPDFYIGDPSIRNTDPITGTSIHQEYIKYGIPIVLGNNDVSAGLVRVASYLKPRSDGVPNWRVTPNCVNLIKEMQRYRWKTYANKKLQNSNNAQEAPHKKDDHACDSLRYFIMSRPDLTPVGEDTARGEKNPYGLPETGKEYLAGSERNQETSEWARGPSTAWEVDEHMGGEW